MKSKPRIPAGVWVLGFVSMLMDVSSEMIHGLLPLYLTVGLGASALTVGIIEGVAESTALIVKVFSGALSDRLRKRKAITAFGYGLAALSKPLFALATGPLLVFTGPFLAMALMLAWSDDFRAVFWVAVIPAILSFALIVFAVREPAVIGSSSAE